MNASKQERWEKLLSFACAIVGMVHFTPIALRFTHDLILGLVIGGVAGSVFGGFAAGLILLMVAEPGLLVFAMIGGALVTVVRIMCGGTWLGMVFAW